MHAHTLMHAQPCIRTYTHAPYTQTHTQARVFDTLSSWTLLDKCCTHVVPNRTNAFGGHEHRSLLIHVHPPDGPSPVEASFVYQMYAFRKQIEQQKRNGDFTVSRMHGLMLTTTQRLSNLMVSPRLDVDDCFRGSEPQGISRA